MTPERLEFLINLCFRARRKADRSAHFQDIANFLGVAPVTLRRWLAGRRPVPRAVELVLEILYHWPEITSEAVERVIARQNNRKRRQDRKS